MNEYFIFILLIKIACNEKVVVAKFSVDYLYISVKFFDDIQIPSFDRDWY